jgi:hypothetical protein
MEKVTGYRRKLYTEELHDLYSSPNSILMIKLQGPGKYGGGGVKYIETNTGP